MNTPIRRPLDGMLVLDLGRIGLLLGFMDNIQPARTRLPGTASRRQHGHADPARRGRGRGRVRRGPRDDDREVACALDAPRGQGKLSRDRDGRYHLVAPPPGSTGIIGELYHDPNDGT